MRPQSVFVSATPAAWELEQTGGVFTEQVIRPTGLLDPKVEIRPVSMQVDDLLDEIRQVAQRGLRTLVTVLTKRMAEDLTEYLHEQGIRVRYMHSDIDTLERIEILRDLRLGAFDVLVGINLLREGLDIPECGLVAILDADKEGFLRSETSLIQTIGRAARNVDGRVILYADRITGSMERAMRETDRRREKQHAYNLEHDITPETIRKNVTDVLSGLYKGDTDMARVTAKVDRSLVGGNLQTVLDGLRKDMRKAAENLEFEEAARLRDEVKRLEAVDLAVSDDPLARQSAVEAASEAAVKSSGRSTRRAGGAKGRECEAAGAVDRASTRKPSHRQGRRALRSERMQLKYCLVRAYAFVRYCSARSTQHQISNAQEKSIATLRRQLSRLSDHALISAVNEWFKRSRLLASAGADQHDSRIITSQRIVPK